MAHDTPLEVRMPKKYVEMLMHQEITGSMLLTMLMLYTWSDWKTGVVERVSAMGLATATHDAFHKNTYQDALVRWEQMGEITREIKQGSHKQFPVTIHNYRAQATKVDKKTGESVTMHFMVNEGPTITYAQFLKGVRVEDLHEAHTEGVSEGVDEAPTEGVERTSIIKQDIIQEDLQVNPSGDVQESSSSSSWETEPGKKVLEPEKTKPTLKPLWDAWKGQGGLGEFTESQICLSILYLLCYRPKNEWYKKNLTDFGFIERCYKKMMQDTPPGWERPENPTTPNAPAEPQNSEPLWDRYKMVTMIQTRIDEAVPYLEKHRTDYQAHPGWLEEFDWRINESRSDNASTVSG